MTCVRAIASSLSASTCTPITLTHALKVQSRQSWRLLCRHSSVPIARMQPAATAVTMVMVVNNLSIGERQGGRVLKSGCIHLLENRPSMACHLKKMKKRGSETVYVTILYNTCTHSQIYYQHKKTINSNMHLTVELINK